MTNRTAFMLAAADMADHRDSSEVSRAKDLRIAEAVAIWYPTVLPSVIQAVRTGLARR